MTIRHDGALNLSPDAPAGLIAAERAAIATHIAAGTWSAAAYAWSGQPLITDYPADPQPSARPDHPRAVIEPPAPADRHPGWLRDYWRQIRERDALSREQQI